MLLQFIEKSVKTGCWKFQGKAPEDAALCCLSPQESDVLEKSGWKAERCIFRFAGGSAIRLCVSTDAQIVFLLEQLSFDEPCIAHSYFDFPTAEDLSCNVADKTKLVLRSRGSGMKWFRLLSCTDGADTLSTCGLLLPAAFPDRDTLRVSAYSGRKNYGHTQTALHVFLERPDEVIARWHVGGEKTYTVYGPGKAPVLQASLENHVLAVRSAEDDRAISMNILTGKED